MRRRLLVLLPCLVLAGLMVARAEERVDQDVYWKIRQEALTSSRIMETLHVLTDLYGPRLTGSPELKAASEWAVEQMRMWGLKHGRLEPWEFGHAGWTNERLSAHLLSPAQDPLVAEVLAWTPSTNGPVRAEAVQITLPQRPTRDELAGHLDGLKDVVKGKMVLVGPHQRVAVTFNPPALRREDADVIAQMNAPPPQGPAAQAPAQQQPQQRPQTPQPLTAIQIDEQVNQFLVSSGALVRVNDAGRDHGQIRAFHNRTFDPAQAPPTVVMRNEDYGRISRLLAGGRTVELEFDIVNRTHPEGRMQYNVIAELPGSDKADEIIMLGAHFDAWHAGTGATDNAIGSAVSMEAMRILAAIGAQPRRTIRMALWSGEEQGLLGSQAYVREHFGSFEQPKPAFTKFGGYVNIDNGTGRARGMTVFGPPAAATVLRDATAPLRDLGVLGATTTRSRARAGSDHTSFNEAGLPGIGILQDPIQYQTYTWHTQLDTYERVVEDDAIKSAIVIAATAYHLATRDELLPRFARSEMPRRPGGQTQQTPSTNTN